MIVLWSCNLQLKSPRSLTFYILLNTIVASPLASRGSVLEDDWKYSLEPFQDSFICLNDFLIFNKWQNVWIKSCINFISWLEFSKTNSCALHTIFFFLLLLFAVSEILHKLSTACYCLFMLQKRMLLNFSPLPSLAIV